MRRTAGWAPTAIAIRTSSTRATCHLRPHRAGFALQADALTPRERQVLELFTPADDIRRNRHADGRFGEHSQDASTRDLPQLVPATGAKLVRPGSGIDAKPAESGTGVVDQLCWEHATTHRERPDRPRLRCGCNGCKSGNHCHNLATGCKSAVSSKSSPGGQVHPASG